MKILSVSDRVVESLYSPQIKARFQDVDLIISCGDLPYYYLEYILTTLNKPLFFVRGNHESEVEYQAKGTKRGPEGAVDLHRRMMEYQHALFAGVEGSLRYKRGPFQYSQAEMWENVLKLVPYLLLNKINHGRFLDVFITHAPAWGIHDQPDRVHQGVKAFRWLLTVFKPAYFLHGHIHVYRPNTVTTTNFVRTQVINTYGYRATEIICSNK